jgi:hypothetical protein
MKNSMNQEQNNNDNKAQEEQNNQDSVEKIEETKTADL